MATISSTTQTVPVHTLAPRTPGYYRLAYDATTKVVKACLFHTGVTKSPWLLTGFDSWAEVQTFATANELTGLPATDPAGGNA